MGRFGELAFTPAVKAVQEKMGSRRSYARLEAGHAGPDALGDDEAAFIAARDSFYLASVGEGGWPYLQHRGGPKGFVRVLDPHTLAFADYRGNRQYISVGNLSRDDRAALIFVDYPNRARLKVLAHATLITAADHPAEMAKLAEGAPAPVERGILLRVEAFDWNCPQQITPRFTEEELEPVRKRVAALEEENAALRAELAVLRRG